MQASLTLEATHEWACTYGEEEVVCGWSPIDPVELNGTVPAGAELQAEAIFSVVRNGSEVEAASVGLPGVSWAGIGALVPTPGIENWYATDLFGDPSILPAPLAAGYGISVHTIPDCDTCTGTICTAQSAVASISRHASVVWVPSLIPGEQFTYTDPDDNSALTVGFTTGEASAQMCPGAEGMAGPQPISVFEIHVQQAHATGGATLPPGQTTTRAGLWPATALLSLAALAVAMLLRRKNS